MVSSTIDSVLNQDFNDFEIILIDDGSSDEIEKNISKYIAENKLIFHAQPKSGVSSARNKGASLSIGEYLIFLDSDDHVTQRWLSDFETKIKLKNTDIIYCGINRFKDNILVEYTNPLDPYKDGKSFGNVIPGSFCIKSEFFKTIGLYDDKLAYGENTELGFRIKMASPTTAFISRPNLYYNMYENSHSKNARNKMNGLIYTINKHPQIFNDNKDMKSRFLSIAGVAASSCREYSNAQNYFFKSLIINPFQIKNYLRLFVVFILIFKDLLGGNMIRK
jgi:glycosyltransferase involved in cell wall biosynthesis